MSEQDNRPNGEENFEAMLDAYTGSMGDSLKVGDRVKGAVISISGDNVFVDTGTKNDGVADKSEFVDEEGNLTLAEGDEVELYVISTGASEIRLSKSVGGNAGAAMIEEAFKADLPVEGRVTATRKGGYDVEVMKRRAFCPVSQIDIRFVENPEEYVNQTYQFKVIKFEQNGRNIVVSRRALLEEEAAVKREEFLQNTSEGDVMDATVTRLTNFGAFAELAAGVEGLIHVSELSWSRIQQPDEAVSAGDTVRVKVLGMETDKKGQLRISLSAKQVQENPWTRVADEIKEGEVYEGKVVRLTQFGAFVEILPGVDGLVHVSEMSYAKRVHKPEDMVAAGDNVSVKIKSIDLGQQRISLSMRDAEGDPWAEVAEKYAAGTEVEGTLEKNSEFGLFINLAPGVTGLMPKSYAARADNARELEVLKPGDTVTVKVMQVRPEDRKLTLGPLNLDENEEVSRKPQGAARPARPKKRQQAPITASVGDADFGGSLGDALKRAIKDKK